MSKILIIEDEEAIADLEKDYLELSGFDVEIATRGDVGLEKALKEEYDLIILDLMLPEVDGFDICRQVREEKNIPIIMVSAKKDDIDKIRGLGLGADDYMTKPFEFEELAARIRALLRRRSPEKTDAVSVGDLTVEFSTRRVTRGGKEINLSSKEFALLESLIRHKGAVLSRTQLENQVWDYGFEGGSNIVDVYIRYLRKKLDDPFEKKLIHTIRGAGYTLREE